MLSAQKSPLDHFPPQRYSALRRAVSVRANDYAQSRKSLDGALTGLSPYLSHGIISTAELIDIWQKRLGLTLADPVLQALTWRCFYQHIWRELGDAIFNDISPRPSNIEYADRLPADIRMAATGVAIIDHSVRQLYQTGYLHAQQRLWLASYIVHLRKIDWRTGADWLYGYLIDGDLASNHLSWQSVAGTFNAEPYLFNTDSVNCFAPELSSKGSAIDLSQLALQTLARSNTNAAPDVLRPLPLREPSLLAHPPWDAMPAPSKALLQDKRLALVHPWMLAQRPDCDIAIGIIHTPFHRQHPWSAQRWDFVHARMNAMCDAIWVGDLTHAQQWMAGAHSVFTIETLHSAYREAFDSAGIAQVPTSSGLPEPRLRCANHAAYLRHLIAHAPQLMQSELAGQVRRLRDKQHPSS